MSRDDATILDMLKAARLARDFVGGLSEQEFQNDLKTQSAALHQLLVLGEAAKRLSDDVRSRHSGMMWKEIAGMRDVLIHHYDIVDLKEVWRTIQNDVPTLIAFLEPLALSPPVD
jgi:uncharacterized protein with HEPN domain